MRFPLALVLLLGLPAAVAGQSVAGGAFAPLPPIGLPLPEIGLPLPEIGLPPAIKSRPRARPHHPSPVLEGPTVVYLVPVYYGWDFPHTRQPAPPPVAAQPAPSNQPKQKSVTGSLRLEIEPDAVLQVYVDGFYVGASDDLDGELTLEPGPHKIELHAPGYETLSFEVKIVGDRTIRYRGVLEPVEPLKDVPTGSLKATAVEKPDTTAVKPPTIYLIPGCYVGNVPPKDARLPATCDPARVITY